MKSMRALLLFPLLATSAFCSDGIKSIKVTVENPTDSARPAANIVLSVAELRKISPNFMPGSLVVTCTSAATLNEDLASTDSTELPSQVDDLDGDGTADELAFQIDLGPRQVRVVTIRYGAPDIIFRLRKDYPMRTNALFSSKIEGLGWESEKIAFRVYFDPRNAVDIYGKRRHSLQLKLYATPEYPYHEESPEGRDIFKVGDAIGIGAVAAWADGKLIRAAEVKDRSWRIVSIGPVRAILEVKYRGWNVAGKSVTVHSRIVQWAGEHGFFHSIEVDPQSSTVFVTGLPIKHGIALMKSATVAPPGASWMATWGEQVVAPGPTATEAISGQNLGLAVLTADFPVEFVDDPMNHLLRFTPRPGKLTWYAMAAWDQENVDRDQSSAQAAAADSQAPKVHSPEAPMNKEAFFSLVRDEALRISQPPSIHILLDSGSR